MKITRWLGLTGDVPVVGVDFGYDQARLALVQPVPPMVVGLGTFGYPAGTVVAGEIRRPDQAGAALDAGLSRLHWTGKPDVRVVVDPTDLADGVASRVAVTTPVLDGTAVGRVGAGQRIVDSVVAAVVRSRVANPAVASIDTAPVAVARMLRLTDPERSLWFARGFAGSAQWTLCDGGGLFELETDKPPVTATAVVAGPDQTALEPPAWDRLPVATEVIADHRQPGWFAPAIGAALAGTGLAPTADLIGPWAARAEIDDVYTDWNLERVR